jgi:hypothetical protein
MVDYVHCPCSSAINVPRDAIRESCPLTVDLFMFLAAVLMDAAPSGLAIHQLNVRVRQKMACRLGLPGV